MLFYVHQRDEVPEIVINYYTFAEIDPEIKLLG